MGLFGKKAGKPAPKRTRDITYRLLPSNYDILSDEEKDDTLRSFVNLLSSSEKRTILTIANSFVEVPVSGSTYNYAERRAYLTSRHNFGPNLAGSGFRYTREDQAFGYQAAGEELKCIHMKDGMLARAYVVYNFPSNIGPAWITILANMCASLNVEIEPVPPNKARKELITLANTESLRMGERHKVMSAEARGVNDLLLNQQITLFHVGVTCAVTGTDKKSLNKNCKEFESQARRRLISHMAVAGRQSHTLKGWETRFIFPSTSLAAFWPFFSSDMMAANGVYIGTNELTTAPVMYDYSKMANYNMTILGASGAGKSMTAKTYVSNFFKMARDRHGDDAQVMAYILDLHGEYVSIADHLGMDLMDLMKREPMGLDPFTLLESADQAADLITEVAEMPTELKSLVISKSHGVRTIPELVRRLREDSTADADDCRRAATFLAQFAVGDLAKVFTGEMMLKDRTIIALRKAAETNVNSMLITLALLKIWQDMRNAPVHVPKLLVIEEAWFVLRMPSTAKILSNIARSGRKENVHMLLMTQDIDEVLSNEHGAAVIKNSSTLMLLRLLPKSADLLQKILELSDSERREITLLERGQAIMRADSNRIKVKVKPTGEQLKMFDTSVSSY